MRLGYPPGISRRDDSLDPAPAGLAGRAAPLLVLFLIAAAANLGRLLPGVFGGRSGDIYVGEVWDAFDLPQYVEAIREGAAGSWLYEGRLWGGSGAGAYFFQLPYLAAGHLAGALALSSLQTLEGVRWFGQVVALAGALLLVRRAVPAGLRAWALFLGGIAGGLGFLFLSRPSTPLGIVVPMDLATPSFNLVNAFLGAPHLALMAGCVAIFGWGFLCVAAGERRGLAGLIALAPALTIHPFELVAILVSAVATAVAVVRTRLVGAYLAGALVLTVMELAYLGRTAGHDAVFAALSASSLSTEVGDLPSLLVSRAWVLLLAALAVSRLWRRREPAVVFLAGWAALSALLNVVPLDPAGPLHRSLEGSSLAFGALAARALPASVRWRALLLGACLISPALQLAGMAQVGREYGDAWVPADVFSLAQRATATHLTGCVVGRLRDERWLVAESRLCQAADPDTGLAELLAAPPSARTAVLAAHHATYALLEAEDDAAGLYVVARTGSAVLASPAASPS